MNTPLRDGVGRSGGSPRRSIECRSSRRAIGSIPNSAPQQPALARRRARRSPRRFRPHAMSRSKLAALGISRTPAMRRTTRRRSIELGGRSTSLKIAPDHRPHGGGEIEWLGLIGDAPSIAQGPQSGRRCAGYRQADARCRARRRRVRAGDRSREKRRSASAADRLAVGSSRIRTDASAATARAIATS